VQVSLLAQTALQFGRLHSNDLTVKVLFQALYDAHADMVVGGHDHDYERFAPQNPEIPRTVFANLSLAPAARTIAPSANQSPTAKFAMPPPLAF